MSFQHPVDPQPGHHSHTAFPAPVEPVAPTRTARRRTRWLKYGAVALVSLFVGVGIGTGNGSAESDKEAAGAKAAPRPTVTVTKTTKTTKTTAPEPAPTVTKTVTAKPKATHAPGPADSFSGEGEYVVGEDIKPGTYKTAGPEGGFGCYWERAKDASGEFGSIIANNNLQGPGRVTLNNGEYFKTNRCQEWKKVG
ncbi:hypothetical protein AB0L85_18620 [Streptomyces sp. NPDC052051]|uniref:hypothetical protein n=1 Tax=Streptomyces sp. NPDC052051 TaxID=3154649 RepID=UPI0034292CAE